MNKSIAIIVSITLLSACMIDPNKGETVRTKRSSYRQMIPNYPLTTRQDIAAVQRYLQNLGFTPGPADGIAGDKTTTAIRRFQNSRGLPMDGMATSHLLQELQLAAAGFPADNRRTASRPVQERHEARFFSESGAVACGAGALLGIAAGLLVGGDATGAIIGGASGCAAGAGANYWLETKRTGHANQEDRLNAILSDLRQDNARLGRLIAAARQAVARDKSTIAALRRQLKLRQISAQQARRQLVSVDENRKLLQQTYQGLLKKQRQWQQVADREGHSPEIDREIMKLRGRIGSLKAEMDELDQLRIISKVG